MFSIPPEISKSVRRQFRAAHSVLDIAVPKPRCISQCVAAGVPQHVRVDGEWHLCPLAQPRKRVKTLGRHRATPLSGKDMRPLRCRRRRARISSPCIGCTLGVPPLGPANVEASGRQLDLMPLQIAQFRGAQAMPIGDQDHGRVTVATAARLPRSRYQLVDFCNIPGSCQLRNL